MPVTFYRLQRPSAGFLAGVFVLLGAVDWGAITLTRLGGGTAAVWPAAGILLGVLLTRHRSHWPLLTAIGIGAQIVVGRLNGDPLTHMAALVLGAAAAVLLGASLLAPFLGRQPAMNLPGRMVALVLLGGVVTWSIVALPIVEARNAALGIPPGTPIWPALLRLWLTSVLSVAVFAPITMVLLGPDFLRQLTERRWRGLLLLAAYVGAVVLVFCQSRYPLLFLPFPILLLLVGELGFAGAAAAALATTLIGFALTVQNLGPITLIGSLDTASRILFLQAYVVVVCATAFPMGMMVASRRRLARAVAARDLRARQAEARLRDSEQRHRAIAENSSDIISRFTLNGQRLYVSPSVTAILGWSVAEMLEPGRMKLVHPDDAAELARAGAEMRRAAERVNVVYRFRRQDRSWAWLDSRLMLVRDPSGAPVEYVSNARDVTAQKQADEALALANRELSRQASTDGLTGVANRRRFDEVLEAEWRRALRAGSPVSLLMVDCDHFKSFNDRYGHLRGDDCLRGIARVAAACVLRSGDLVVRYGGEEFAVLLPNTDESGALEIGDRLRAAVQACGVVHSGSATGVVTVSIGAACMVPMRENAQGMLVAAADRALYAAKQAGRNRVHGTRLAAVAC